MKNKLTIVGLGPDNERNLTLGAIESLKNADIVIAKTTKHPSIPYLKKQGIVFESIEYNNGKSFDQDYQSMIEYITGRFKQADIVLALPGNPKVNDKMVCNLIKEATRYEMVVEIVPGIEESGYSHNSSIHVSKEATYDFKHLEDIVACLRAKDGCSWDRQQTHQSLRPYLIEEAYEVLDAIDRWDMDNLSEELGDLLLQIVLHSQIAKERGDFDVGDVIAGICKKMIYRHPHVFKDVAKSKAKQVLEDWETIKQRERGHISYTQLLKDIPRGMPALMRAKKVQKKASVVGFDWDKVEEALKKLEEEIEEFKEVYLEDIDAALEEMGDILFATVNVARFLDIEPELALTATIDKFIKRFGYIEQNADGKIEDMTLKQMDKLWDSAKDLYSKD